MTRHAPIFANYPLLIAALAVAAIIAKPVRAELLPVVNYSMPNGYGQAHGGTYNYWDATYSNCVANDCTTDGAPLSGGTGVLTDGVIPTLPWYDVSNDAGTGQYVGWEIVTPTITFQFPTSETVNQVELTVDNSHVGGVTAPEAVVVDGTSYPNPAWQFASVPELIDITGLDLTGSQITVTLDVPTQWVFLGEAQFFGSPATAMPEPASLAMFGIGLAGLAALRRRQSRPS